MRSWGAVALGCIVACGRDTEYVAFVAERDGGDGDAAIGTTPPNAADAGADVTTPEEPTGSSAWFQSGSRLRATWWKAADGARQFVEWFDPKLQTPCRWTPDANGVDRCIPTEVYYLPSSANQWQAHYSDAACTQGVATRDVTTGCGAPLAAYVAGFTPMTGTAIYQRGARVTAKVYRYDGPSQCVEETDPGLEYYVPGAEIPSSDFVTGTMALEATSDRLTWIARTAADGARQRLEAYDKDLGTGCAPMAAIDDTTRCAPAHGAQVWDRFVDSSCTQRIAQCNEAGCPPHGMFVTSSYASLPDYAQARTRFSFFRMTGAAPSSAPGYVISGGGCEITWDSLASNWGVVGTEVLPSSMVVTSLVEEATPTRLRRRVHEGRVKGRTDVVALAPTWSDTQLQTDATLALAFDGKMRGLPTPSVWNPSYLDDACTVPAVYAGQGAGWAKWVRVHGKTACETGAQIRVLTREVIYPYPTQYWRYTTIPGKGAGCWPFDAPDGIQLWKVGADVTTSFQAFDRVVE